MGAVCDTPTKPLVSTWLGPKKLTMTEGPLERWLHLHVSELGNREVQMLDGFRSPVWVMAEDQLCEPKASEGKLGTVTSFSAHIKSLLIVATRFARLVK